MLRIEQAVKRTCAYILTAATIIYPIGLTGCSSSQVKDAILHRISHLYSRLIPNPESVIAVPPSKTIPGIRVR